MQVLFKTKCKNRNKTIFKYVQYFCVSRTGLKSKKHSRSNQDMRKENRRDQGKEKTENGRADGDSRVYVYECIHQVKRLLNCLILHRPVIDLS